MIPADYLSTLARIESGNRPFVKAKTSSASGLYQFTRKTWTDLGGAWGPHTDLAFGGLEPSPSEQIARARELTQENADRLAQLGLDLTSANLYGAHFLGPHLAGLALKADDAAHLARIVGPAVVKANEFLADFSVADFKAWLDRKVA